MSYNMQTLQAFLLSVRNVVTGRVFIKLRTFFGSLEIRFRLKRKVSFVWMGKHTASCFVAMAICLQLRKRLNALLSGKNNFK